MHAGEAELLDFPPKITGGFMNGKCIVCGRTVSDGSGFPPDLPPGFEGREFLRGGDVICPRCMWYLRQHDLLSKKSWIVYNMPVGKGIHVPVFRYIARREALDLLLHPPPGRFIIFIAKTGGYAWLSLVGEPQEPWKIEYKVAMDDKILRINRRLLVDAVRIAVAALNNGISRPELEKGCRLENYIRMDEDTWRPLCSEIEELIGTDEWTLVSSLI